MTAPARQPWWKRKRWVVAVAVWLTFVAYPLSIGPAYYASNRGLIPYGSHLALYQPIWEIAVAHGAERSLKRYVAWWTVLGRRHAASD